MILTTGPQAQPILDDLRPLTTALYDVFPEAAQVVLPYFLGRDLKVERLLFAHMLRFEVGVSLRKVGFDVEQEAPDEEEMVSSLSLEAMALSGLAGTYKGYRFRILKSDGGDLPVPGPSKRRQAFYSQQLALIPVPEDGEAHPNVVILWDFEPGWKSVHLALGCPKSGDRTRASVQAYFVEPVPHPITAVHKDIADKARAAVPEPEITLKTPAPTQHIFARFSSAPGAEQ